MLTVSRVCTSRLIYGSCNETLDEFVQLHGFCLDTMNAALGAPTVKWHNQGRWIHFARAQRRLHTHWQTSFFELNKK